MVTLRGVIETALYVNDLDRASSFYEEIMDLPRIAGDQRFRAYSAGAHSVFLLFKRGTSNCITQLPSGSIGPHDGHGQLHVAFAVSHEEIAAWEHKLAFHNIAVESRMKWPRGGTSIYFRDPDQNLLELATPGMWSVY